MGFSAEWLALREPADLSARDGDLMRRAAAAAGPDPVIVDLGCGSGSTVRAMAPVLPAGTRWRLVDTDPALLALAARAPRGGPGATTVIRGDVADIDTLPLNGATLVTASALLDLVSEEWVRALAARLEVPFYAALSYDGAMSWEPADPRDGALGEAFNRHQRGDKGLGPALGPDAAEASAAAFEAAGFEVRRAASPWRLGPAETQLQNALVDGIATAAAQAGETAARDWATKRRARSAETVCCIGHGDILALPKGGRS